MLFSCQIELSISNDVPVPESYNRQTSENIDCPFGTANCILCFLAFFLSGLFGVKCIFAVPYSTVVI